MDAQFYLFWCNILLTVFYLFYQVLLKREMFFLLNRIYLLTALCLSLVIPLLDLSSLIELPKSELMVSTLSFIGGEKMATVVEKELNWISVIYWTGVMLNAALLFFRLLEVKRQIKLREKGRAFSFWRTKVIDQELDNFEAINAHENVHIKQLHTLDILLVELIAVFFWFNPLIYCYRNSLKLIHEYLADEYAAKISGSKKQYAMVLFLQNFKAGSVLTNTFYNPSLLEARIKMLQSDKPNVAGVWKYVLCIPLIGLITMMCSFSTSHFNKDTGNKIDQTASFPGGFEAFRKYLVQNSRKVSNAQGKVKLSFIVETNGEITNEKIENSLDEASDKEALRIINLSPKWKPALQNDKKVRSAYQLNMNF